MERNIIIAKGEDMQEYDFWEFSLDEPLPEYGGVYIVSKKKLIGKKEYRYIPIYIGETGNFAQRFEEHEKWEGFIQNDANVVGLLQEEDEDKRLDLEEELIASYRAEEEDLPCNDQ